MTMMTWGGQDLDTIGELLDGAIAAMRAGKADVFLARYRASNPEHADANLGYIIGYLEPRELRQQMYEAYQLTHPIFGGAAS